MTRWETTSKVYIPGESWFDGLRRYGAEGWEPWHMEKSLDGYREIYFKRAVVAPDSKD